MQIDRDLHLDLDLLLHHNRLVQSPHYCRCCTDLPVNHLLQSPKVVIATVMYYLFGQRTLNSTLQQLLPHLVCRTAMLDFEAGTDEFLGTFQVRNLNSGSILVQFSCYVATGHFILFIIPCFLFLISMVGRLCRLQTVFILHGHPKVISLLYMKEQTGHLSSTAVWRGFVLNQRCPRLIRLING